MSYLLDTSTCIQISSATSETAIARFRECLANSAIYVPSVVLYELLDGVYKSGSPAKRRERLQLLLNQGLTPLSFEYSDAEAAGRIRAVLEAQKRPIGPYDTLIAGQSLARGLTLVTANSREFARVDGLQWEDWSVVAP